MTAKILLRVVALVCFLLAALQGIGMLSFTDAPAAVPLGLALWVGSEF